MKNLIISIVILSVALLYLGHLHISFKPFSISLPLWHRSLGTLLLILGVYVFSIGEHVTGYKKGLDDGSEKVIKYLKEERMKVITIKQPFTSLIVHGIKDIENRTWVCPRKYIGKRVLIHASRASVRSLVNNLTDEQVESVYDHFSGNIPLLIEPKGAIIGSVEIVDCVINHPSIWAEKTDNYTVGMNPKLHEDITGKKVVYNWVLANPILFEKPIKNVKGKLSFWDYPSIKEVKVECPECGSIEIAVEDYTTAPFPTFLHSCNKCGHMIMESEWNVVNESED